MKLVCEKIGDPLKSTHRISKSEWEIRLEMQIKNLRQKAKVIKQRKNDKTNRGNKLESTVERRKIKKISRQGKIIQTKQGIPKQRKEFYQQSRRR